MSDFRDVIAALKDRPKADPIYWGTVRGEALQEPVFFQGRQWAVTGFGVECRDGTYPIAAKRLWEEEKTYGWVRHLAEKEWVDLEDFIVVLGVARVRFQELSPVD